ncbi:MAG: hypothetical protein PHC29_05860 [Candidatus Omnitrophica bacterium]|nr:hypothetical protein [Candidatus Omnitrophota bacterium]
MKINPCLLKLDLFCRRVKIDSTCGLPKDARPILRTRVGLESELELVLGKDLYVNVPVVEHFIEKSPYVLVKGQN